LLVSPAVSNEELDNMLREIDSTGTGELNFVDFVKSMTKKPKVDYSIEEGEGENRKGLCCKKVYCVLR